MVAEPEMQGFRVRWESASVVGESLARCRRCRSSDEPVGKSKSPKVDAGAYTLFVLAPPDVQQYARLRPTAEMQRRAVQWTTLSRKKTGSQHPIRVELPVEGPVLLAAYFSQSPPITVDEGTVEFTTLAAPGRITVQFQLEEMQIAGQLIL